MCAECFKTERNIIKLLRANYILREIDHAAFCHPYLVVVPVIPAGNQHTELLKGNCPDVIRFYPLPVQTEPLPAKAGRFALLLKQPKVVSPQDYHYFSTVILPRSYQSYFFPVNLGFVYIL